MRIIATALLCAITFCAASAQVSSDQLAFEVASVKRSDPDWLTKHPHRTGAPKLTREAGRLSFDYVTLARLLMEAYGVQRDQIIGPSWLDDEHYDIVTTLPTQTLKPEIAMMWQNLLAKRFGMAVHVDMKPRRIYALVVGKNGPKLERSKTSNGEVPAPEVDFTRDSLHLTANSMDGFALVLSSFLDHPVVDATGLQGTYDITLGIGMANLRALQDAASSDALETGSLFGAVADLGLRLERRSEPAKFVIVDRADKIPTEN
jgi:uncharacterized protein (TIGR03435 family)